MIQYLTRQFKCCLFLCPGQDTLKGSVEHNKERLEGNDSREMEEIMKDNNIKFPLNIQYFADEGSNGDSTDAGTNGDNTPNDGTGTGEQTYTKADLDRAVTKAVQTRDQKSQVEQANAITEAVNKAVEEYKRQEGLTEEQRLEEAQNQANKRIADKEAELNMKVLKVDVGQELLNRNLDSGLLDYVIGEDLEQSIAKIEGLETLIDTQVENRVKEVITKPGVPKRQTSKVMTKEEIMAVQDQTERQKLIKEHIDLFD